jgi:hypothetical protein
MGRRSTTDDVRARKPVICTDVLIQYLRNNTPGVQFMGNGIDDEGGAADVQ